MLKDCYRKHGLRNDAHFLVGGTHRRGVGYSGSKVKPKARHAEIPRQGGEKRLNVNIRKKNLPGIMRPDANLILGIDFLAPGTCLIPINLPGDLDSWLNH